MKEPKINFKKKLKQMTSKNYKKKKKTVNHNVVAFGGSYVEFNYVIRLTKLIQMRLTLHLHPIP